MEFEAKAGLLECIAQSGRIRSFDVLCQNYHIGVLSDKSPAETSARTVFRRLRSFGTAQLARLLCQPLGLQSKDFRSA